MSHAPHWMWGLKDTSESSRGKCLLGRQRKTPSLKLDLELAYCCEGHILGFVGHEEPVSSYPSLVLIHSLLATV